MEMILPTLNQLAYLFLMIGIGYILARSGVLAQSAAGVLSKLEITVLIPALILSTFIDRFTPDTLATAWQPFLYGLILLLISVFPSYLIARFCSRDAEMRNIYVYGLCFSNFSFMGNALVSALYPDYFFEYLIFSLPLWILVFAWATPSLLMPRVQKRSWRDWLKVFWNPLFLSIPSGMILGLLQIPLPDFAHQALDASAASMSPVAMLLTGISVASVDWRAIRKEKGIYLFSVFRLLVFPLAGIAVLAFLPLPVSTETCILLILALPPGLNAIIIPAACGRDTKEAAGMTILSHLFSCVTIPLMLYLFETI